jgi:hypothetical protein
MTTTASIPSSELLARLSALEAEVAELKERIERAEVLAAVKEGVEQVARGEVITLQDFDAKMRAKYNIPPR